MEPSFFMKNTLIITTLLIISGYYFFSPQSEETTLIPNEPLIQEISDEVTTEKTLPTLPVNKQKETLLNIPQQTSQSPSAKYPNLGKDFVPFDEDGNRYITQIVQSGRHLTYHGDVLLGDIKDLKEIQKKGSIKVSPPRKWNDGKIPYKIDDNLPNYDKVLEAVEYYNQLTNIKFIPYTDQKNYVFITLGDSDCYSYVGMMGGMQEIFLTPLCGTKEITHELSHTIGFLHEQNREDRDEFIEVLWDNIDPIHHTQFKKIPNDFLGVLNRPFDMNSLMMYSSYTFSAIQGEPTLITTQGEIIPPNQNLLSDEDIKRINLAYPAY